MAMAFMREGGGRVALSFIGDGGSSLGEWHEAINLCAARRLPAVFCIENNQTALSTSIREQSAVRAFADKAVGYGVAGVTTDGTDPDSIAAAFTWAADRAREGHGPALIEVVTMRMCGHAHHDDMLHFRESSGRDYPALKRDSAYADAAAHYALVAEGSDQDVCGASGGAGIIRARDLDEYRREADALVDQQARSRRRVLAGGGRGRRRRAGDGTGKDESRMLEPAARLEVDLARLCRGRAWLSKSRRPDFPRSRRTGCWRRTAAGPAGLRLWRGCRRCYGNAFLLLRPLLAEFGDRIINSPLAEGGVLGVCVGAALAGQRPIGEMQFNDFVANGFNQLVNNAAKIRCRWGGSVPMVAWMPWGGLRHAGPCSSQNTEPWFYRTPGLKIVVPSTPEDARALMAAAYAIPTRCSSTSTSPSIVTRESNRSFRTHLRHHCHSAGGSCGAPATIWR